MSQLLERTDEETPLEPRQLRASEARRVLEGAARVNVPEARVRRERLEEVRDDVRADDRVAASRQRPRHDRRRDRQAGPRAGDGHGRRVLGDGGESDRAADREGPSDVVTGLRADDELGHRRGRVIEVRREVPGAQRVHRAAAQLREMEVACPRLDGAENRAAAVDGLPFEDERMDVDVAVLGGQRSNLEPRCAEEVRDAVGNRIDGRATRRSDVDAVVEAEPARTLDAGGRLVEEHRTRVPEVRADRMGLVERLDRPGYAAALPGKRSAAAVNPMAMRLTIRSTPRGCAR